MTDPAKYHEDDDCDRCHAQHRKDGAPIIWPGFERCKADACEACGGTGTEKLHTLKCHAGMIDYGRPCACVSAQRECLTCGGSGWDPRV